MAEKTDSILITKKTLSAEYKALVRAAEAAKKQAELLGLPYVTKNSQLSNASI